MRHLHRAMFAVALSSLLAVWLPRLYSQAQAPAAEVPIAKGGAGPCSADFVVTDASHKPIYDAKIRILIKYGFMGSRKLDLEVGTNADGKARFEGLPQKIKPPAEFTIRRADLSSTVPYNPAADCHPRHDVTLAAKPAPR
jgi:hypothetical protein